MSGADPKAAEREAHALIHGATCRCKDALDAARIRGIIAWAATRERDAAVGALRDAELIAGRVAEALHGEGAGAKARVAELIERGIFTVRLALEQGTPATCASCGKPMEGERFTVHASVRADLVGKTVGRCCWPPDHGAEGYGEGTPATREETPAPKCSVCGSTRMSWVYGTRWSCDGCQAETVVPWREPTTGGTER